jgi:hypothetical protein
MEAVSLPNGRRLLTSYDPLAERVASTSKEQNSDLHGHISTKYKDSFCFMLLSRVLGG